MENNQIFGKKNILIDILANTKEEALKQISDIAYQNGVVDNAEKLYMAFLKREEEGTTGFEDGFSIPHAKLVGIKHPTVYFVKYKKGIDWPSMDNKITMISIVLMIPENDVDNLHLKILSDVSRKLISDKNRNDLKATTSYKEINEILFSKNNSENNTINNNLLNIKSNMEQEKELIIGITACPVGVAHTYLAADKLTQQAIKMGYNVKIETHGSSGVENKITDEEISKAKVVIIAADIGVDTSQFNGKKIFRSNVSKAIKNPEDIIKKSLINGSVEKPDSNFNIDIKQTVKIGVMKHLMSGVSYMVPMVIVGGIFLALSIGLTKIIYGNQWLPGQPGNSPIDNVNHTLAGNHFLTYVSGIGGLAFTLMIPILGAYIADSIAGRSAIVPAMLASIVGNTNALFYPIGGLTIETPTGFLGAIGVGLAVGYLVKWINTWKVPKNLKPAMPLFFMPIIVGGLISLLFVYAIGAPIGWVMEQFKIGITSILKNNPTGIGIGIGIGFLIGAMSGFDLGGPINKIAFFTVSALVLEGVYEPMGMMATAGAVPPLGMFATTVIFRKFFDEEARQEGVSALIMGVIGISEGAIPFAIKDPKRAIVANVLGSGIGGAMGGAFLIQDYAAHTGPIVVFLGAVPFGIQTALALLSILIGVVVTTTIYGIWLTVDYKKGKVQVFKETDNNKKIDIK